MSEVSVVIFLSLFFFLFSLFKLDIQTQQALVNPLTCCEGINSSESVISLEKEHSPRKTKTLELVRRKHGLLLVLPPCL